MTILERIAYWIFPRRCEICGNVVDLGSNRCESCLNAKRISTECCYICGKDNCKEKHKHSVDYEMVVAPFYYDNEILAPALHNFKFNGFSELSRAMVNEMLAVINEELSHINFDAVTYVPISKKREDRRGYNQSYLLAELIAKELNVPLEHCLYKAYENPPQRTQKGRKRKANVFASFDVNDDVDVEDKLYLLIDDVKTTGSTLNECSATLKAYGAKAIYCCTFAIR